MSTTTHTTTEQAPPAVPPSSGNNMNQVGSGPAALLYSLSDQLIRIYSELQALYNKMTKLETNTQSTTITAGADAQRAAASDQAAGIYCQAAGSFASAAVTGAQTGFSTYENSNIETKIGPATTELNSMQSLESKAALVATNKGPNVIISEDNVATQNATVQNRALEIKNGIYTNSTVPGANATTDELALQSLKQGDQLSTVRENLQTKIANQSRIVNNYYSQIQTNTTKYQSLGQIVTGVVNSGTQCGQAAFTTAAGSQQAAQQVSQGVQQMANSTAENTRQGIGKYYDQIAGLIAAARAGAQAYAQT